MTLKVTDHIARAVVSFANDRGVAASIDADLGARTTYRVGGPARVIIETSDPAKVGGIGEVLDDDIPIVVVGNGSNILVSDMGFDGVVVAVTPSTGTPHDGISIEFDSERHACVLAAARVRLPVLARQTVAAGFCGLEWAVGVPGSVGGAVRMNAGGHGSDIAHSLTRVELLNIRTNTRRLIDRDDLGLRFRGSALSDDHAAVSAEFQVDDPRGHECEKTLADIVAWRREHQPGGQNAGSVFVNPGEGDRSAGALIESCGLRGKRLGSAEVSSKHANFLQADIGGKSDDVVALMTLVQETVRERTGVSMRSEVRLLGFSGDVEARFIDPQRVEPTVVAAESRLRSLV